MHVQAHGHLHMATCAHTCECLYVALGLCANACACSCPAACCPPPAPGVLCGAECVGGWSLHLPSLQQVTRNLTLEGGDLCQVPPAWSFVQNKSFILVEMWGPGSMCMCVWGRKQLASPHKDPPHNSSLPCLTPGAALWLWARVQVASWLWEGNWPSSCLCAPRPR